MTATHQIREALRKKYCLPEWVLMEEVRDAAGFDSRRSADGIAMSMWPSRGLEVHGFEIKASRSDWLREIKNPAKAEAIANYCDKWWIVAAQKVVNPGELPPMWGLLEQTGADGLKVQIQAPTREDVRPLDRSFVAAMLRRAGQIDEYTIRTKIEEATRQHHEEARQYADREIAARTKRHQEVIARLELIKEKSGIDILGYSFDDKRIAAALKFALAAGDIRGHYMGLEGVRNHMDALIKKIDALAPMAEEVNNGLFL